MAFAREIVLSHDAEHIIDNEIKHNPQLDDFWIGFTWFLARGPEHGCRVPNTNPQSYVIHFYHWNVGAIVVTYRFDNNQVEVLDIRIIRPSGAA